MQSDIHIPTLIIGASAVGLACAACLKRNNIPFTILEQSPGIGCEWQNRYDRLHLHTPKKHSQLPFYRMPSAFGKYVSKADFTNYLKDYANALNIRPLFNQKVNQVIRRDDHWLVTTTTNQYTSEAVIIATGNARQPVQPHWEGLENFSGEIIHSSQYKNGRLYENKKVLVVGFGNSACEIALCLHENGSHAALSVRHPVNVVPRDLLGISIIDIVIAESFLSPSVADALDAPILRLLYGNLHQYGLKKSRYGPLTQIRKYKKIPMLDIGTMGLIKTGKIKVYPGIQEVKTQSVQFANGQEEAFDVIIAATGFHPGIAEFVPDHFKVCDEHGCPTVSGKESALPGLYFCGFNVVATGMIREIAKEAMVIAHNIASSRAGSN